MHPGSLFPEWSGEHEKPSIFLSIPRIVFFSVFWPLGNPMFPDKVQVFREMGVEGTQGREMGAFCAFAAFPAPGMTLLGNASPYGAIRFTTFFPARETAFEPDYRLQDIGKAGILAECLVSLCRDRGILVKLAFFQFDGKGPCGGE
jgi:hypothetical protein